MCLFFGAIVLFTPLLTRNLYKSFKTTTTILQYIYIYILSLLTLSHRNWVYFVMPKKTNTKQCQRNSFLKKYFSIPKKTNNYIYTVLKKKLQKKPNIPLRDFS